VPTPHQSNDELFEKIRSLSPDRLAKVEKFVDILRQRGDDSELSIAALKVSEDAFRRVWDNPDDAEYDRL
jgi:hypothetical protein